MNSKELVIRAIHHKDPVRIPVGNFFLDWGKWKRYCKPEEVKEVECLMERVPNDILNLNYYRPEGYDYLIDENDSVYDEIVYDEWGAGWLYIPQKVIKHPLINGWNKLADMKFPDPDAKGRFDRAASEIDQNKDKYVLANVWFTLFERLWFLRGMENMLVDPMLYYDQFKILRDKIMDFNMRIIEHWIEIGVDGIFFSDDWGSQAGLLINPDEWRQLYKPCYKIMFDRVKSAGIDVWMHLCGNISTIIPDLIEIGLDVYNPVQSRAVDINWLQKEFGGYICFNGGIDVQKTLPYGTPKDVKDEVDMLVSVLGSSNGGYIMGTTQTILPDTPVDNIRALVEAVEKYTD